MNAVFTGRKRRGKTTRAFSLALETGGGVIVFDPKREFRGWPDTVSDAVSLEEKIENRAQVVIFHPVGDSDAAFSEVGALVLEMHTAAMQADWEKRGLSFTLLVDEAQQLQNSSRINPHLKLILSQCRPEILNVFQTMQSPTDAYRTTKVCNSDWFLFQTTHIADVERIEEFAGPEVAATIAALGEQRAYVHFSEDTSRHETVDAPESWHVPLEFADYSKKERDGMSQPKQLGWDELVEKLSESIGKKFGLTAKKEPGSDGGEEESETENFVLVMPKRKAS